MFRNQTCDDGMIDGGLSPEDGEERGQNKTKKAGPGIPNTATVAKTPHGRNHAAAGASLLQMPPSLSSFFRLFLGFFLGFLFFFFFFWFQRAQ